MKVTYLTLIAGATLTLLSATARAEESAAAALAAEGNTVPAIQGQTANAAPATAASGDINTYCPDSDPVRDFILRAGAWSVHPTGSLNKIGEYQNLQDSAFWNADGLVSNGMQTIDASATGSDDVTGEGRLHYFGPHVEADLYYEQFEHQLDAHTYAGFNYLGQNNTPGPSGPNQTGINGANNIVLFTDDNQAPKQDFAIRVQEWKANFKGSLTDSLKWRLNVFGIDKEGYRQVNEFQHCSAAAGNGSGPNLPGGPLPPGGTPVPPNDNSNNPLWTGLTSQCHVTSQAQHIDWKTTEIVAALEWRLGENTTIEYSHTFRDFTADDQNVAFNYDASSTYSLNPAAVTYATAAANFPNANAQQQAINNLMAGYAIVPDNQTQIDRVKFSSKIGCSTDVYMLGYVGYNEDELRDTYRNFNGADLRITNKSIKGLTVTAYGKYYDETSTSPLTALTATSGGTWSGNNYYQEPYLGSGPQISRQTTAFGINERWRPFEDQCSTLLSRLSIVSGYEYSVLRRELAGDTLLAGGPAQFVDASGYFTQPDSNKNTFTFGAEEKWSACFNTFLRYKFITTEYPLYGITPDSGQLYAELNSSLPTQENRVELGCTWTPTDTLMVNATLYVENAMSDAPYVAWTSNSLPFTLSAWWALTPNWSLSAGASEMDSWINQNGVLSNLNANPGTTVPVPWQYTGVADVLNFGTRYQATERLSFTGDFEYVRGMDSTSGVVNPANQVPALTPGSPTTPYNLGSYSLVKMQSFRLGAGADYRVAPNVTTYLRYNYYDYQDDSGSTSGQVSMILGGMSAKF